MKTAIKPLAALVSSSLIIGLLSLGGCDNKNPASQEASTSSASSAVSAPQPASASTAYAPPTAEQLYQLVAPIALFPDQLVAQVLAGSTYPDQITAANQWLAQNPSLKGDALANAANQQPWDVSVKSLTAFPAVLAQMAQNIAWTTSLGEAYANDPNDVMNAIQVMRERARASGHLKASQHLNITTVAQPAPPPTYDAGPVIVSPPPQTIVIEPVQPDVVYVPAYDPAVVYGAPVALYPGYVYSPPVYEPGAVVGTDVLSFGAGVVVGAAIWHYGWGWHAWGMNWGGHDRGGEGWRRPAVTYNHTDYVSRSTTIVNHINNARITNNFGDRGRPGFDGARPGVQGPQGHERAPGAPMTEPHFSARDLQRGARPPAEAGAQGHRPGAAGPAEHGLQQTPGARAQPAQHQGEPHFSAHDLQRGARPSAEAGAQGHRAGAAVPMEHGLQQNPGARAQPESRAQPAQHRPEPHVVPHAQNNPAAQAHHAMPRPSAEHAMPRAPAEHAMRPQAPSAHFAAPARSQGFAQSHGAMRAPPMTHAHPSAPHGGGGHREGGGGAEHKR